MFPRKLKFEKQFLWNDDVLKFSGDPLAKVKRSEATSQPRGFLT
jgi:hypothetical protein